MRQAIGGVLAVSVLLAACTDEYDDDVSVTSTPPLVVQTAAPDDAAVTTAPHVALATEQPSALTAADLRAAITDEELLHQVEWVLAQLDPGAEGPPVTESALRFGDTFLEQVPAVELALVFAQLRAGAPYAVTLASQGTGAGRTATLALDSDAQPLLMTLTLDDDGRIGGLLFQPDTSGELPVLASFDELDDVLVELGGTSQVVVGTVRDGGCTVEHTTVGLEAGGDPAPSGSVVKLLVLSALVDAIAADDLDWGQELTISEELVSLPSGVLQDREPGSLVTVREAAALMISVSDNTATDLLMDAVGQTRLRDAAEGAGIDPTRVMPIPTTRQLFQLGWQVDSEVRTRWSEAQVPEVREAILADLPAELDLDPALVTEPRWEIGVDWALTGGEICALHARLQQQADLRAGEPVREILSANPGIPTPDGVTYQAFKGGAAPGVLAFSFYLESQGQAPGEGRVLVVQTASAEPVDPLRAATLVEAGLRLLAGPGG